MVRRTTVPVPRALVGARRKVARAAVVSVVTVLVAVGGLVPLDARPAAAAPALTLSRATGLLDGEVVIAQGAGFTPRTSVRVVQCIGPSPDWCPTYPPVNGNGAVVVVGADGTFTARLRLWRTIDVPGGADEDCTHSDCSVLALGDDGDHQAQVAIDVADTGEATRPAAALSVATTSARANRVVTTWTGSGFDPTYLTVAYDIDGAPFAIGYLTGSRGAYLALCVPSAGGEACHRFQGPTTRDPRFPPVNWLWSLPVDAHGNVAAAGITVPRVLSTRDGRVDCAVVGCRLALTQDDFPLSVSAPVAWAPEWAPYPSAAAFVADAYPRLVGRAATASERAAAVAGLTDRSLTARRFVTDLAERSDGRRYAELSRLYQAALARRPDGNGLSFWAGELRRHGGDMSAIASAFGRTAEFRSRYGPGVSDQDAVRAAYLSTLGRAGTDAERAYWVGRLRAGLGRSHMVHLFARTPEFVRNEGDRSRATAVVVGLLGRGPTSSEWAVMADFAGINALDRPVRVEDQLLAYLGSEVLRSRVA